MPTTRLTKRVVDATMPASKPLFVWDSDPVGFGLKVSPSGRRSFVVQYRIGGGRAGRSKRYTIGSYGSLTVEQARIEAKRILGLVALGQDPADLKQSGRRDMTLSALCQLYLDEGMSRKKPSTIATDRGRIERHIIPLLGSKKVKDISRTDAQRFLNDVAAGRTAADERTRPRGRAIVRGGKGTATRTLGLLSGILSFAVDRGIVDVNPVHGVKAFPSRQFERFLSNEEIQRIGTAMAAAAARGTNRTALDIIKLLILTGARRGEIEALQWREVDFELGYLRFADSKTGQKVVPLNQPAHDLLGARAASRVSEYVFPAVRGTEGHYGGTVGVWRKLRAEAGLPTLRIHDLRHTFASVGASSGLPLFTVGKLLGHATTATTSRYAHLAEDPVREASNVIAAKLAAAMDGSEP